jgi:hypothetical protein
MSDALYDRVVDAAEQAGFATSVWARDVLDRKTALPIPQALGEQVGEALKEATTPMPNRINVGVGQRATHQPMTVTGPIEGIETRAALEAEIAERTHRHRFVEVPNTRHPGRLLGTEEAEVECECGKSRMVQVSRK